MVALSMRRLRQRCRIRPAPAPAAAPPRSLRDIVLFFAGPFMTIAYIALFPFIGLTMSMRRTEGQALRKGGGLIEMGCIRPTRLKPGTGRVGCVRRALTDARSDPTRSRAHGAGGSCRGLTLERGLTGGQTETHGDTGDEAQLGGQTGCGAASPWAQSAQLRQPSCCCVAGMTAPAFAAPPAATPAATPSASTLSAVDQQCLGCHGMAGLEKAAVQRRDALVAHRRRYLRAVGPQRDRVHRLPYRHQPGQPSAGVELHRQQARVFHRDGPGLPHLPRRQVRAMGEQRPRGPGQRRQPDRPDLHQLPFAARR